MIHIDNAIVAKARRIHLKELKEKVSAKIEKSSIIPDYLKQFLGNNLKDLLTGEPNTLLKRNVCYHNLLKKKNGGSHRGYDNELRNIFDYQNFIDKKRKMYDAYDLAQNLGIRVCPYCNRLPTVTIQTGIRREDHITRPQFDHFFFKDKFPLLALSFYNLIPSCSLCNTTLKGKTEFDIDNYLHPYIDNQIDNYEFVDIPNSYTGLVGAKPDLSLQLKYDKSNSKLRNSFEVFKIEAIYNGHIDEVKELLQLRSLNNDDYLQTLMDAFPELKLSKDQTYRLAFGTYYEPKYFYLRPMSKMKYDLLRKLGIIK